MCRREEATPPPSRPRGGGRGGGPQVAGHSGNTSVRTHAVCRSAVPVFISVTYTRRARRPPAPCTPFVTRQPRRQTLELRTDRTPVACSSPGVGGNRRQPSPCPALPPSCWPSSPSCPALDVNTHAPLTPTAACALPQFALPRCPVEKSRFEPGVTSATRGRRRARTRRSRRGPHEGRACTTLPSTILRTDQRSDRHGEHVCGEGDKRCRATAVRPSTTSGW